MNTHICVYAICAASLHRVQIEDHLLWENLNSEYTKSIQKSKLFILLMSMSGDNVS